ncbi:MULTISPECIES: hypothetical protein [Paenibacillus]|uniref:hypothetical protein n=1 Tax=Paenibacillus TaxID=44249 RepID=UPI0015E88CF6|nr:MULTISPECIES: hypothetical protein [Paenibacillus]
MGIIISREMVKDVKILHRAEVMDLHSLKELHLDSTGSIQFASNSRILRFLFQACSLGG